MTLQMTAQPDDVTCGPTSLHAVYRYYGELLELDSVIDSVHLLEEGGTLAAFLGIDALTRGYEATIYSYDLHVFDPSWNALPAPELREKLSQQLKYKRDRKMRLTTKAYLRFLELGGEVRFADLSPELLQSYFDRGLPVLAGLSATYLYGTRREVMVGPQKSDFDDLRGEPSGHFVVLFGTTPSGSVLVADPYRENPFTSHLYEVDPPRLLTAILLGIVTYDANLLIVKPKGYAGRRKEPSASRSGQDDGGEAASSAPLRKEV